MRIDSMKGRVAWVVLGLSVLIACVAGRIAWLESSYAALSTQLAKPVVANDTALIARGAYVAVLGNCTGCHTATGGLPMAGGRALKTPFGTLYASNLTPDARTGLGQWSADDFYRAMHTGQSKNQRLLYPAFPYSSYSAIDRQDSDALWAYFQSLAPVVTAVPAHELRFPYNLQASLAVWRWLFFTPEAPASSGIAGPAQSGGRGAYLARQLGHCEQCHAPRNRFGAIASNTLSGAVMFGQDWYAPSLIDLNDAGVALANRAATIATLSTGQHNKAVAVGPMASVVFTSLQYWQAKDIEALTDYLIQAQRTPVPPEKFDIDSTKLLRGAKVYEQHCSTCHAENGLGEPGIVALSGNRSLTSHNANNLVKVILQGGFAPATSGNPQPYGMPPFAHVLNDEQIGDVVSFIRQSWGNKAAPINELQVRALR
jgi:mono/diheme cytochrome c family protein